MTDPSAPHRSHARGGALQRGRSIPSRPPLRVWAWIAAAVALLIVATLLWRGSDAAATESTTAPPADVPSGTPAGAVSEAWSADGGPPELVVSEGRVLVGSERGVRALDPLTGEEAWHYSRANARMCGLTVTDGVAVAVFATADRCDEAVGLDAGTGVREWTRSLNLADDAVLDSTRAIVLAANPTGVLALDPTGSGFRWRSAAPEGCRFLDADAGSTGVVVVQRCADSSDVQVRLFDGFAGSMHWNHPLPAPGDDAVRLLGADGAVTVLAGDDVWTLSGPDGSELSRQPVPPGTTDVDLTTVGTVSLLRVDGTVTARDTASGDELWTAPAVGLPVAADGKDAVRPGTLVLPDPEGFSFRDPATGAEVGRSTTPAPPASGAASAVGPVVVVGSDDGVVGYR